MMACCGQGAMLLALKAGEIKRRSRFQRSPSEKKTPSIMPSAPWIKEPHVASRLPGGQRTRVNKFKKKIRPKGPLLQSSFFLRHICSTSKNAWFHRFERAHLQDLGSLWPWSQTHHSGASLGAPACGQVWCLFFWCYLSLCVDMYRLCIQIRWYVDR